MLRLATAFAIALLALAPLPAAAQDLAAIEAAEKALDAAWEATPLSFRKVLLASEVIGYGAYVERTDARFRVGNELLVYAEPVGYGYKANADGTNTLGYRADVRIKTAGGELVLEQNDAATVEVTSHARNREFYLTFSLNLTGAPAGEYVLEYVVQDIASDETATISMPFSIVE
jgi:hypothetical protein